MKKILSYKIFAALMFVCTYCSSINATPRIAILDFKLNDITSLLNTPEEISRTVSIKPSLEQALSLKGDYQFIQIGLSEQRAANSGFWYLFRFHDIAAKLGGVLY